MDWIPGKPQTIEVGGDTLEALCHGPPPGMAKTIFMLHEGLGCVALWRDFPERLSEATGLGVFLWSRAGYGGSDPCGLPRSLDYMRIEGEEKLPRVLDAISFQSGFLLGHSDGATIAMHFLGAHEDHRVSGAILLAPHFFVEDESISAISAARDAFNGGNLRERLAPYHSDVDVAFRGWNNVWLDPGFRDWDVTETIAYPRVPILALQGTKDPYGTRAQIDVIAEEAYCPVETRLLRGVRHAPHLEATADTLDTIATFITRVDRLEQFGADPRQAPSATV